MRFAQIGVRDFLKVCKLFTYYPVSTSCLQLVRKANELRSMHKPPQAPSPGEVTIQKVGSGDAGAVSLASHNKRNP